MPIDWAKALNNLGNTLLVLGERETGTARFEEAVTIYHAALEKVSRESDPYFWDAIKHNLDVALQRLHERGNDSESMSD